jgi:hypothetical protein
MEDFKAYQYREYIKYFAAKACKNLIKKYYATLLLDDMTFRANRYLMIEDEMVSEIEKINLEEIKIVFGE